MDPHSSRFSFPNSGGNASSVSNYLKRHLKPLGQQVGAHDLTQRCSGALHPRTCGLRGAIAALDAQITGTSINPK
jgi:hypothetical protein